MNFKLLADKQITQYLEADASYKFVLRIYHSLKPKNRDLARFCISRHLVACERVGCLPDYYAIREIVDDASKGISIALENHQDGLSDGGLKRLTEMLNS